MRTLIRLIALIVPRESRPRWREEWMAELHHGGWRMVTGALPDAWAMRRVAKQHLPAEAGSHEGTRAGLWLPASAGRTRNPLHAIGQDVRYSLRALTGSPGFVLGVVLSLSLGIGGNIVAFTFINAAVFRPFPGVHKQHELVRVSVGARDEQGFPRLVPPSEGGAVTRLDGLRAHLTTLDGLSAHAERDFALSVDGQAYAGAGGLVSSNYFDILGVKAAAGRFFVPGEDSPRADPVAVISYTTWQRRFNGESAAIGKTMTVNGAVVQVIGVAAEGFHGIRKGDDQPDVWIPLGLSYLTVRDRHGRPANLDDAYVYFDFVGRRKPGVTLDQVSSETTVLAAQLKLSGSSKLKYVGTATRVWLNDPAESAPAIVAFMVIPLLVLAISCVNAANLLMARAARQARDWSVRMAIGASRWRVIRHVLTEALMLSLASAVSGLLLARSAIDIVERNIPVPLPFDYRVAAFTLTVAIIAAAAFSLGPALGVIKRAATRSVTSTSAVGTARSRARFALVALQAALSLGLLTTGAQFTNTVFADNPNAARIPDPDRLVLASFDVDPLRMTAEEAEAFYERVLVRARQTPGVSDAGLSTPGLVTGFIGERPPLRLWAPLAPSEGTLRFGAMFASPGSLPAIGVPLVAGRHFTVSDTESFRTVIVNEPFAKAFVGGNALGRTIRVSKAGSPDRVHEVTIVGIAGGMMKRADNEPPILYHPMTLIDLPERALYLRIDGSGRFSTAALHTAVRDVDPRVPIMKVATLRELKAERNPEQKLLARAAGILGILALLLAAGGLYGVVSYVVSLRRQEIGVRLTLGAEPHSIVRMITRQALTPALIGAAVGLFAAGVTGAVVRSRLYGTSPVDPMVFVGATLLLTGVLFAATVLPASRAARINPIDTLRTE